MPSSTYFDEFDTVFSSEERSQFWDLYFYNGIPFTVLLISTVLVLYKFNWRVSRVDSWVALAAPPSIDDAKLRSRVWMSMIGTWVLVIVTLGALVAWGVQALLSVEPVLIGVAMVTIWPGFFVFCYGLLAWYGRGWRMDHGVASTCWAGDVSSGVPVFKTLSCRVLTHSLC